MDRTADTTGEKTNMISLIELIKKSASKMSIVNRRHIRIKYPKDDRAYVRINGSLFPVSDLSVSGVKFISHPHQPSMKSVFNIQIQLLSGFTHDCKAQVVRLLGDFVMMQFDEKIPVKTLQEEALWLERKYGKVYSAREY